MQRQRGAEQSGDEQMDLRSGEGNGTVASRGAEKQETGAVDSSREREGEGEAAAVSGAAGPGGGPVGAAAGAA